MTPGARIQTAIELLGRIEAPRAGKEAVPADTVLSGYFRGRRYIGAKDRRAIADLVYKVLRNRGALDWTVAVSTERNGEPRRDPNLTCSSRSRVVAALPLLCAWPKSDVMAAFDGGRYGPAPLSETERDLIDRAAAAAKTPEDDVPLWVVGGIPKWLEGDLVARYGDDTLAELQALNRPAPVDLRVNGLKGSREDALAALAAAGIDAEPTPTSPLGIRLAGRSALPQLAAYRDGLIEVQDEGSQIVALMTDARPGMDVLDLCAGAGGKTLALAAMMENRGRLVAADTDGRRLSRTGPRLGRAGVSVAEPVFLDGGGALPEGGFERVLVDAPCSGSGAWRRNPDAKWRLTPEALEKLVRLQGKILEAAARAVKPGGRLVYATCSMLPVENEAQVERFLGDHPGFGPVRPDGVWRAAGLPGDPGAGPWLQLTPHRHRTDGFFIAILERAA